MVVVVKFDVAVKKTNFPISIWWGDGIQKKKNSEFLKDAALCNET